MISPCGKCRQLLFDTNPDISCIVREPNGLTTHSVAELLPYAYDWRAMEHLQRMYMWEGYEQAIRAGSKTQTIRVDDPFVPGEVEIVFEKESGEVVELAAEVTAVEAISRAALDESQARADGFSGIQELQEALDKHYPGLESDAPVDVVQFQLR